MFTRVQINPVAPIGKLWETILAGDDISDLSRLPENEPDPMLSDLFERPTQVYDPDAAPFPRYNGWGVFPIDGKNHAKIPAWFNGHTRPISGPLSAR